MTDLQKLIDKMEDEGYEGYLAEARVCQDLILRAISGSTLSRNVTIKGGVVMRGITGRLRRTFSNRTYKRNVERAAGANWLDISYDEVTEKLISYVSNLSEL